MEIVFLKSRNDTLTEFKKYKSRVEKKTGRKIIKLRSDNAKNILVKSSMIM